MNIQQKSKKISRALISVYHKDGIEEIANKLNSNGIEIISTGGTYDFLKKLNILVTSVESVTSYPSILGGRVKTLHPKIFGGILSRRDDAGDVVEVERYEIPNIDLVIVDLYPFEEYVAAGASHEDIIEKIDIGGISLIRAAAKNYNDVIIVPSKDCYGMLLDIIDNKECTSTIEDRELFASYAFMTSSHYDTMIFNYFNKNQKIKTFSQSVITPKELRYGENPQQKATYFGNSNSMPEQLHGKEISYNNMLDIEAAIELISDFNDTTVAIIKHNNACGCAVRGTLIDAWKEALSCDPISAFGGIIVTNSKVNAETASEIHKIFFEVIIAPDYEEEALNILKQKKNRIILKNTNTTLTPLKFRSMLDGVLVQDRDSITEKPKELNFVTTNKASAQVAEDLVFANILVKHSKSNAIVLAKDKKLMASGIGQTSRVDALNQAIAKAQHFGFNLNESVMASDAFFPFPDCVEIAHNAGVTSVIHPGGSIKDNESIEFCEKHNMTMAITGNRHFKH